LQRKRSSRFSLRSLTFYHQHRPFKHRLQQYQYWTVKESNDEMNPTSVNFLYFKNKAEKIISSLVKHFSRVTVGNIFLSYLSCCLTTDDCYFRRFVRLLRTHHDQSDSDPIPTWLLKECASVLVPTITNIVNFSLTSGQFQPILKESAISPLLNKSTLDKDELSNYRPVSNLSAYQK